MHQLRVAEVSKRLHLVLKLDILLPVHLPWPFLLVFASHLELNSDAASKRARRWHLVEAGLDQLSVDVLLFRPACLLVLDLVLDDANGDLPHNGICRFKLTILVLVVIVISLLHRSEVKVVDAQILVCLHLGAHVVVEPGELEVLLEAACSLGMLLEKPIDVSKLLVSHHLVVEHLLLLALVLESPKDLLGLLQVLKVHTDHPVSLEGPVEAMETVFIFLFEQAGEGVEYGKHGALLLLPRVILALKMTHADNLRVIPLGPQAHSIDDAAPLEKLLYLHLVDICLYDEVQIREVVHYLLLQA